MMKLGRVEKAIEEIRQGRMIIVADDEDRENEGDLVMAAEMVTAEHVNFMAKHGRGLICVTLTPDRADELELAPMSDKNTDPQGTAFTVSVDAHERFGVTTGISAHDRAKTIQTLVDKTAGPEQLVSPGHMFPLEAVDGGVLERPGHTEAAVDLARMAGLKPAGAIYAYLKIDGITDSRKAALDIVDKTGVGLAPGSAFGNPSAPFLRACFLRNGDQLAEAADRLADYITRL